MNTKKQHKIHYEAIKILMGIEHFKNVEADWLETSTKDLPEEVSLKFRHNADIALRAKKRLILRYKNFMISELKKFKDENDI